MMEIEEYIKELKQNPRFKDYNITIDNYNNFLLMSIEDMNDGKNNPVEGYYHEVRLDKKGNYEFYLLPCKNRLEDIKKNKIKERVDSRFSSNAYETQTMDLFRTDTIARKKAFKYITSFINDYSKTNFMKGLYLHGSYGSGKTFLMSALANEMASLGYSVSIVFVPDLCRELKRLMFKDDSEDIINDLKNVDILILDDLGAENLTGYIRDDVLGPIINYRWSEKKPFFIASNFTTKELLEHLSQTKEDQYNKSADYIKAARIFERIKQSTIECEFKD